MQTTYNCKFYKHNNNLNLTCTKNKKRCILLSGLNTCYEYTNKSLEELIRLSEEMGLYQ